MSSIYVYFVVGLIVGNADCSLQSRIREKTRRKECEKNRTEEMMDNEGVQLYSIV